MQIPSPQSEYHHLRVCNNVITASQTEKLSRINTKLLHESLSAINSRVSQFPCQGSWSEVHSFAALSICALQT